jgi:hypothetical protein
VAYLEGHKCHIACSCLVLFLLLEHYLGGHTCGDGSLTISGVDHFLSYGALHLVSTSHIHPWSWLPSDSHVDWLHASYGPLDIVRLLLWSILLGKSFYYFICHAPWRVHF